jgi:hypothetical protein
LTEKEPNVIEHHSQATPAQHALPGLEYFEQQRAVSKLLNRAQTSQACRVVLEMLRGTRTKAEALAALEAL